VPAFPLGNDVVVIANVATPITSVSGAVAVWGVEAESTTWTVNVLVPAVAGVPDRMPAAVNVNPTGSVPLVTVQL
jgi:hypothetical protein